MKLKGILSLILVFVLAFTSFGCSNSDSTEDAGKTKITVMATGGGYGETWIKNVAQRFSDSVADKSYEEGKKGVVCDITSTLDTGVATMASSGYNVYFASETGTNLADKGTGICIDDIVKEKSETINGTAVSIEDKILEEYRSLYQGRDGKYYAIPSAANYSIITYDIENFTNLGFYLADESCPEDKKEEWTSDFGKRFFVKGGTDGKKACGTDGVFGTVDDGLPTSVVDFLIMCDKMHNQGVAPMTVTGQYIAYTSIMLSAFWSSLAGASGFNAALNSNGVCEVVKVDANENVIYTNEPLFAGYDKIKKPETEVLTITEANGYRANDSFARYVTTALTEIMNDRGWFSNDSTLDTCSHINAQTNFVCNGYGGKNKMGMLIEGSYWYNEAMENKVFDTYKKVSKKEDKNMGVMTLPTAVYESVTGKENAREFVMFNESNQSAFINSNIASNEGLVNACKDFLKFCYTSDELVQFTQTTGMYRSAIDYKGICSFDESVTAGLSYWQKSLYDVVKNSNVIEPIKGKGWNEHVLYPNMPPKYTSYLTAVRNGHNTAEIFDRSRTRVADWGFVS